MASADSISWWPSFPSFSIPPNAQTLDGFIAWAQSDAFPKQGRISYINGELVVEMSPEEIDTHNQIKAEIGGILTVLCREEKLGRVFVDGTLLTNKRAKISNEPDALFAKWDSQRAGRLLKISGAAHPQDVTSLEGTPDWVLEIVSRSSVKKDTQLLRTAYFQAGIPEYWLVDPLSDPLDFQLLVAGEREYVAVPADDGWRHSPVFGRSFRLEAVDNPLGEREYVLQIRR